MKTRILFLIVFPVAFILPQNTQQELVRLKIEGKFSESPIPDWAGKVVWYQIFPERFRNGDATNDPTLESTKGAYPNDLESAWQIHPWGSDWYELQPYEKQNGKDIWYNIQRRRYGGDLQGIIDKLDYLKDLGIGAIYLNPVFMAPSAHKYDASSFHHIDPYFGPDPEGDIEIINDENPADASTWKWTSADKLFLQLIKDVHQRGMKIIIDGVFNHMGINSWAFKDVEEKQQQSEYKDWFNITSWRDEERGTNFEYSGWGGVKELPEFKEDENGIVEGPKRYIYQITKRWMDPNNDGSPEDGIDGWRLDVAYNVSHKFWKDYRVYVKSINPNAYLTAEVVDSIDAVRPYLLGDEFDAVMNYNFLFTCSEFFIDDEFSISAAHFNQQLDDLRNTFPLVVAGGQQNLLGSHDTPRIASQIVNKNKYNMRNWAESFNLTKGSNKKYDTRKPTEEEYERLKLLLIFQMTYIGAPYIYYGDEVGMWGANDPDCRKPMIWDDITYDTERLLPDQTEKQKPDTVNINYYLLNFYKKLIAIRNNNVQLQLGDFELRALDDASKVFIFKRSYQEKEAIIAINNGNEKQLITLTTDKKGYYTDVLNNNKKVRIAGGKMVFTVKPKWGRILIKNNN